MMGRLAAAFKPELACRLTPKPSPLSGSNAAAGCVVSPKRSRTMLLYSIREMRRMYSQSTAGGAPASHASPNRPTPSAGVAATAQPPSVVGVPPSPPSPVAASSPPPGPVPPPALAHAGASPAPAATARAPRKTSGAVDRMKSRDQSSEETVVAQDSAAGRLTCPPTEPLRGWVTARPGLHPLQAQREHYTFGCLRELDPRSPFSRVRIPLSPPRDRRRADSRTRDRATRACAPADRCILPGCGRSVPHGRAGFALQPHGSQLASRRDGRLAVPLSTSTRKPTLHRGGPWPRPRRCTRCRDGRRVHLVHSLGGALARSSTRTLRVARRARGRRCERTDVHDRRPGRPAGVVRFRDGERQSRGHRHAAARRRQPFASTE